MPTEDKQIVLIISTMRAGSTLLKALLSTAPDAADLPETNFQRYCDADGLDRMRSLAEDRIIILKRPGWFNELSSYPRIPPFEGVKKIVLIRDVYPTARSVHRMVFRGAAKRFPHLMNRWFAETYWRRIYENAVNRLPADRADTAWVRYEDLTSHPVEETARLFAFIGSVQTEGIDSYAPPDDYQWRWGTDDGGEKIKSLKVQPPKPIEEWNERLVKLCETSKRIQALRKALGYSETVKPRA